MRVALTGAATGIGAATAARLRAGGHEVTAFDIVEPPVADRWIDTDMNDAESISAALEAADGPFDALINNAGLPPRGDNAEMVLRVNFIGLRQFMSGMLDKLAEGAAIVNTASRAGIAWRENIDEVKSLMALQRMEDVAGFVAARGLDATRAYSLSKEAVIALTRAETRRLLDRGMRANAVCPSAVATGILNDFMVALGERAAKSMAFTGRAGTAEEVAALICFLASPDSFWIKGQDILIDGGISATIEADALGLG